MRRGKIVSQAIFVRQSEFSLSVCPALIESCTFLRLYLLAVNAIELIDYGGDLAEANYVHMIQMFHRFLVDHLAIEDVYENNPTLLPPDPSFPQRTADSPPIAQLFGMCCRTAVSCTYCNSVKEKEQVTFVVDLIYPRKVNRSLQLVYSY
jgi:PAB-dependent poly(A)-specific ribonuclease subunit 2